MSHKEDNSPARNVGQGKSADKAENNQLALIRGQLINKLLAWLVEIVESKSMRIFESRVSLIVQGAWLPGMGDYKLVAGLTNKPEATVERLAKTRHRFKLGATPFLALDKIATSDADADKEEPPA